MKKIFFILATSLMLVGCGKSKDNVDMLGNNGNPDIPNRFGIIETHIDDDSSWYILYDKKTGVEYFMIDDYPQQSLSPLYDRYGNVLIYEETL